MVKAGIVLVVVSLVFVPLALVAAIFGFSEVAGLSYLLAKVLAPVFLVTGIILLVVGIRRRSPTAWEKW